MNPEPRGIEHERISTETCRSLQFAALDARMTFAECVDEYAKVIGFRHFSTSFGDLTQREGEALLYQLRQRAAAAAREAVAPKPAPKPASASPDVRTPTAPLQAWTLPKFSVLVRAMRRAQKAYFSGANEQRLKEARDYERRVDGALSEIDAPPALPFEEGGGE